ncbi:hypothetical protein EE612_053180, partial [Oryza sativa]
SDCQVVINMIEHQKGSHGGAAWHGHAITSERQ